MNNSRVRCLATTLPGLEAILTTEISPLHQVTETGPGAVLFSASLPELMALHCRCRTAMRFYLGLGLQPYRGPESVTEAARAIAWEDWFSPSDTFAVRASSRIALPEKALALSTKDGIADRFRQKFGKRPDVDRVQPAFTVRVDADKQGLSFWLDTTGEPLSHRGYRVEHGDAPASEVLAAAALLHAGWKPGIPLCDPFCGSGTIAIEAALMQAGKGPASFGRSFAFMKFPGFKTADWQDMLARHGSSPLPADTTPLRILASDRDSRMLEIARRNVARAGVQDHVVLSQADFFTLRPMHENGVLVANPPYGERLVKEGSEWYRQLGQALKDGWAGWNACLFLPGKAAIAETGLRTSGRIHTMNGPIEISLANFRLYKS